MERARSQVWYPPSSDLRLPLLGICLALAEQLAGSLDTATMTDADIERFADKLLYFGQSLPAAEQPVFAELLRRVISTCTA